MTGAMNEGSSFYNTGESSRFAETSENVTPPNNINKKSVAVVTLAKESLQ